MLGCSSIAIPVPSLICSHFYRQVVLLTGNLWFTVQYTLYTYALLYHSALPTLPDHTGILSSE